MAIIFDEMKYCEDLDNSTEKISRTKDIMMLIKWYRYCGYTESEIKEKIYNKVNGIDAHKIQLAYQYAKGKTLKKPFEIFIYKEELELIKKELNYEYQKYLFIALCLCKYMYGLTIEKGTENEKYKNILFVKNNSETSRQRIYTLSGCKETREKKPFIGHCLKNDGFIEVLGLDMWRLLYLRDEGEVVLKFVPHETMVYEYRKYMGENVCKCERCGKWIYKKSNRTKYCKDCANLVYNEQRREKYQEENVFENDVKNDAEILSHN